MQDDIRSAHHNKFVIHGVLHIIGVLRLNGPEGTWNGEGRSSM